MLFENQSYYPQVNYGQAAGQAWNPASRQELFGMVNKAKYNDSLANLFAADILTAKGGLRKTGTRWYGSGRESQRAERVTYLDNRDPLYLEHSLNGAQSWAAQAFDTPVLKGSDGNYYYAKGARAAGREPAYNFSAGEKVADQALLRRLGSGVVAFTAKGANGETVLVPYAEGYVPKKGEANQGKSKGDTAQGATERDARTANTVAPQVTGDPLGLQNTLLSGAGSQERLRKTLLG